MRTAMVVLMTTRKSCKRSGRLRRPALAVPESAIRTRSPKRPEQRAAVREEARQVYVDPAVAALIGVVLGGAISGGVEVYRSRNSRRDRLADIRREAYARLLALSARAGFEATMLARRTHDEFGGRNEAPPIDPARWPEGPAPESARKFAEMSDELTLTYEQIRLVSSDGVARRAKYLMQAIGEIGVAARSGRGESADDFTKALRCLREARTQLRLAMRHDLIH